MHKLAIIKPMKSNSRINDIIVNGSFFTPKIIVQNKIRIPIRKNTKEFLMKSNANELRDPNAIKKNFNKTEYDEANKKIVNGPNITIIIPSVIQYDNCKCIIF